MCNAIPPDLNIPLFYCCLLFCLLSKTNVITVTKRNVYVKTYSRDDPSCVHFIFCISTPLLILDPHLQAWYDSSPHAFLERSIHEIFQVGHDWAFWAALCITFRSRYSSMRETCPTMNPSPIRSVIRPLPNHSVGMFTSLYGLAQGISVTTQLKTQNQNQKYVLAI